MRVLLLIPKHPHHADAYFFGIASLSAVLKQEGHEVEVVTIFSGCAEELASLLGEFEPGLVGCYVSTDAFPIACEAFTVAHELGIPVVVGGPHTNAPVEELLCEPGITWVCRGEGEGALRELASRLERGEDTDDIANLSRRDGETIASNPMRPLIKSLDALPLMDRSFRRYVPLQDATWRELLGISDRAPGYADDFLMSRGCPYTCAYCTQYEVYEDLGLRLRIRDVDAVIDEIEGVMAERPLDFLYFHDDILAARKDWFAEFAPRYAERIGVPFCCNMRPDKVTREHVENHVKAGAFLVSIGLESGNDHIRRDVLKRPLSKEEIAGVFRMCREAGIYTTAYVMVGIPGETEETMRETVEFCQEVAPDVVHAAIFNAYPGTPLYETCRKEGWITTSRREGTFFEPSALTLPGLDRETISRYHDEVRATARFASTPSIRYSGAAGDATEALTTASVGRPSRRPAWAERYDPASKGFVYDETGAPAAALIRHGREAEVVAPA